MLKVAGSHVFSDCAHENATKTPSPDPVRHAAREFDQSPRSKQRAIAVRALPGAVDLSHSCVLCAGSARACAASKANTSQREANQQQRAGLGH